jgi:phosphoserine/homoserine phosphotransferase
MKIVCLDLEGVLVPEIWIAFADSVGIPALRCTTRDEPDYDKLMHYRLDILKAHNLKLPDIQKVISTIKPLDGALEFIGNLRKKTQLIILSDTFLEFAGPLMAQLNYPTIFCNSLVVDSDGTITGYTLREQNGKREAVKALKGLNIPCFAAGDSYNDIAMIDEADRGVLFCAPKNILETRADLKITETYDELSREIDAVLNY